MSIRKRLLSFDDKGICWIEGHCLNVLKGLPAGRIQCCVTSPPYWGLRSYLTPPQVWGGEADCPHVWGNERCVSVGNAPSKKSTMHGGKKEKNHITKASQGAFCQKCGAWRGELGLEPTPQLYISHLVEIFREVRRVLTDDGVLWLNLGDSYASGERGRHDGGKTPTSGPNDKFNKLQKERKHRKTNQQTGLPAKNLIGIPWRAAFALQDDGWILRSECIWYKRSAMPESVADRPNRDHEHIFLFAKNKKYYFDMDAVRVASAAATLERDKSTRITKGKDGPYAVAHNHETPSNPAGRNLRTVWDITTQSYKKAHFAVYPKKIPERCIKAGSKAGDIVLDPFGGSGVTAYVAAKLGRRAVSIELNPDFQSLGRERVARLNHGFWGAYDVDEV